MENNNRFLFDHDSSNIKSKNLLTFIIIYSIAITIISIVLAWTALLVTLVLNFLFPVRALLDLSFPLRLLGSALLIGAPVFFTAKPRLTPSVGPMAIVLTLPSPNCCWTSKVNL